MKRITSLVVGVLLLAGCGGSAATLQSADEFAKSAAKPGVVVLDVRTPGEFQSGHIWNAINIDVEGMTFNQEIAKLDKSKEYAVYCRSGRRSAIATEAMSKAGFKNLVELSGGIQTWNGPLVTP